MRSDFYEVDIKALTALAKIAGKPFAVQILDIDAPASLLRIVGREIMLRAGWSLAKSSNVLSDLWWQVLLRVDRLGTGIGAPAYASDAGAFPVLMRGPPLRHRSKNAARLNASRAAAFQPREGVTQNPGEDYLAQVVPKFCVA
ncbi:hypothetical protein AC629_15390 [Bradyrhizobium sp. NAS80.1]|nr:hypothetical protein AC629_15390 [Bradyrhizobium sp. NAS80.1]